MTPFFYMWVSFLYPHGLPHIKNMPGSFLIPFLISILQGPTVRKLVRFRKSMDSKVVPSLQTTRVTPGWLIEGKLYTDTLQPYTSQLIPLTSKKDGWYFQ